MTAPMTIPPQGRPDTRPAYLIFEFERRAYPIRDEPFTIGRANGCDIVIREPAVSRVHAQIIRAEESFVIKPVGATPTVVNGLAAAGESKLHHGDVIDIGSAKLTFNEFLLPVGVSIVDKARRKGGFEEVANRRDTITNPIMSGRSNPNQGPRKSFLRPAVLIGVLLVVAAYYFGVYIR